MFKITLYIVNIIRLRKQQMYGLRENKIKVNKHKTLKLYWVLNAKSTATFVAGIYLKTMCYIFCVQYNM